MQNFANCARRPWVFASLALWMHAGGVQADPSASLSTYGTPGLVDMPTAFSLPDAQLATTFFHMRDTTRGTVAFQITPRLTGAFRYSVLEGLGGVRNALFDRSFDLHYRFVDEGRIRPAVAVGLRDFIGTGVYSSEYIVASKNLGDRVALTFGMGWGRLGTAGGFSNPLGTLDSRFDTRPVTASSSLGGQLESTQWFRGDAAFFGGFAWQANPKLQVKLEYSSDAYSQEAAGGLITPRSRWNLGAEYRMRRNVFLSAFAMHGDRFGAGLRFTTNPKASASPSGTHGAPFPIRPTSPAARADLGWQTDEVRQSSLKSLLVESMTQQGLEIERFELGANSARIYIRNGVYQYGAESIGRTARILSQILPDSVGQFEIVPVALGMAQSMVTVQRSDLELLEHAPQGSEEIFARSVISEAPRAPVRPGKGIAPLYPRFTWRLAPYARISLFDPDYPIRTDYGLALGAEWNPHPGLYVSGRVRHRLGGNIDNDIRPSNSVLPRVRSNAGLYAEQGRTALETLTVSNYFRPGPQLYGRFSLGYLEPMFAGVSAELLWKPVKSNFALGVEANHVWQRDFDQGFGVQDYNVTTGHISAYWALKNSFHLQVDAGRYLAGDYGATVSVDREFRNGWRVGAYATLTDVSFEDFGEGSFDKGLRFTIPLGTLAGAPTRTRYGAVIQPLSRDGGARLNVDGRLYEQVRDFHRTGLESSWGRFWR